MKTPFSIALAFNKVCQWAFPVVYVNAEGTTIALHPFFAKSL